MASCLSVDAQSRRCDPTQSLFRKFTWSAERSISPAHLCPHGLWASLRHPARRRVVQSAEGLEGASDPVHLSGMYKIARVSRALSFSSNFRPRGLWASLRRSVGVLASAHLQSTHRNLHERDFAGLRSGVVFWIEEWSFEFVFTVSSSRNMSCGECVAAHLRGCWRSLFYCGVYLLPKVLHDSSEFRFLYSLMACFAIRDTVEEYALLTASLHSATRLCTLVSPSLP